MNLNIVSLSEVSLSDVSLSEVSLSDVSLSEVFFVKSIMSVYSKMYAFPTGYLNLNYKQLMHSG